MHKKNKSKCCCEDLKELFQHRLRQTEQSKFGKLQLTAFSDCLHEVRQIQRARQRSGLCQSSSAIQCDTHCTSQPVIPEEEAVIKNTLKQLTCDFREYPQYTSQGEQAFWARPIGQEGIWKWAASCPDGRLTGYFYLLKAMALKVVMPVAAKTGSAAVVLALAVAVFITCLPQDKSPVAPEQQELQIQQLEQAAKRLKG